MMLSVFSNMLGKESDLRVVDNLCAALCRMIKSNVDAVPLEQVQTVHKVFRSFPFTFCYVAVPLYFLMKIIH